jgi:hypothetical protein
VIPVVRGLGDTDNETEGAGALIEPMVDDLLGVRRGSNARRKQGVERAPAGVETSRLAGLKTSQLRFVGARGLLSGLVLARAGRQRRGQDDPHDQHEARDPPHPAILGVR